MRSAKTHRKEELSMPRVCPVCHRESPVESDYCPACGAPMDEHVASGQKKAAARAMDNPPMKWHKFLTWFSLPLSLVVGVVTLIGAWQDLNSFDPSLYIPEYVDLVKTVMRVSLISEIVILPLILCAEIFLVRMQWTGVRLLLALYAIQMISSIVLLFLALRTPVDHIQAVSSVLGSAVILVLSGIYYRKRRKMFV